MIKPLAVSRWSELWPALAAGGLSLVVYGLSLAPGITSEDAGELVAAAALLGVPHPPGFPLWVLTAHAAIVISPATAAWTANLMSALFGASTVGALVVLALRLGAAPWPAMVAAWIVGFGTTFWSQSVIAEVYTLNTLLLTLALAALVGWGRTSADRDDRGLLWAAFFCGLGLTNHHPLTLLAGPAMAVYAYAKAGRRTLALRCWGPALLALLAPLILYLYLPWAAGRQPPINWGDPSDWSSFWAHVSRRAYAELERGQMVSWSDKSRFLAHFVRLWAAELTPWALIGAGLAGVWRMRDRASELGLLVMVIGFNSVVLLFVLRFEFEPENIMRVNEYFLPTYVATGAIMAVGLDSLQRALSVPRQWVAAVLMALLPGTAYFLHRPAADMSSYHLAEDFNRFLLRSLPERTILFPSGDYVVFPVLYLHTVEKLRPDVLIADYTGRPSPEAKALFRMLEPTADVDDPAAMQLTFLERSARPVVFAAKGDVRVRGLDLRPWGLAYRAWRRNETPIRGPKVAGVKILRHFDEPGPIDDLGRSIIADYHRAVMEDHLLDGWSTRARIHLDAAEGQWAQSKEGLNNLGSVAAEHGLNDDAVRLFRAAAALSPGYVTARRNLAYLLEKTGRTSESARAFEALIKVAPDDEAAVRRLGALRAATSIVASRVKKLEAAARAEPYRAPLWNNLGTAYIEAGRPEDALRAYREAVRIRPDYAMAHRHLAHLYAEYLHDPKAAAIHSALAEAAKGETSSSKNSDDRP